MIFIDSNIPMYLVGERHPHKIDAQRLLEQTVAVNERLVTDAEVFQEILHRYTAIDRRDAIQPAFAALLAVVDAVFPIELEDVERAKAIVLETRRLSSRGALQRGGLASMRPKSEAPATACVRSTTSGFSFTWSAICLDHGLGER